MLSPTERGQKCWDATARYKQNGFATYSWVILHVHMKEMPWGHTTHGLNAPGHYYYACLLCAIMKFCAMEIKGRSSLGKCLYQLGTSWFCCVLGLLWTSVLQIHRACLHLILGVSRESCSCWTQQTCEHEGKVIPGRSINPYFMDVDYRSKAEQFPVYLRAGYIARVASLLHFQVWSGRAGVDG